MTRKPSWFSLVLALSLVVSGPATIFAQDNADDENGATKIYLPHLSSPAQVDVTTNEFEDDEAPAVTAVQTGAAQLLASANSSRRAVLPAGVAGLRLETSERLRGGVGQFKLPADLRAAQGPRQVIVRLREPSVAENMALQVTASAVEQQLAQLARVEAQQNNVVQLARSLDGQSKVLGVVKKALNAVMLEVDAAALAQLAADPAVLSVKTIVNYQKALTDTVPYVGASAVQAAGYNGAGVKVAVVDSGVDYTHAHFGGAGTLAAYELAYGVNISDTRNTTRDGLFPTADVVDGMDFVGEFWPDGGLAPDDDPIDFEGHGTHVADIIGGNKGVAPGVDLYAVKVCATLATACSGVALIQAMDYVVDPNGDGDMSDRMDIVNMSLGSDYGTAFDDDLSLAVENISQIGVLVVASAGNGGDKPFKAGTPANAPSALSVAQTQVPAAIGNGMEIISPTAIAAIYEAVFQPWSAPLTATVEAPVQYGDGAGGNLNGCAEFAAGALVGKIGLVDRGTCNISVKISNIGAAGGLVGVVGLIAPGDPSEFGFGGGAPTIPGYNISQTAANRIKAALAAGAPVVARFDPASGVPLVGTMAGTSSRGPSLGEHRLKPEIGAPGASVSAVAGSGAGVEPFSGTSGAAPMVSGVAALLHQAYPERSVPELKALLMNTGETNIMNKPAIFGGVLAAITRIGGGEVRADRALAAPAAAWDVEALSGGLSFFFPEIIREKKVFKRTVNIRNYSDKNIRYNITPTFRFEDDVLNGAVEVKVPDDLLVRAHSDRQFEVTMIVRGDLLRDWGMNSGARGASGANLSLFEYDGYLLLTEEDNAANQIHLPWQVLPRKAGDVTLKVKDDYIRVRNRGVATTTVESYSLIAVSPNLPEGAAGQNNPTPDLRYVGYATYPVPAGFCADAESFLLAFALNTWERQTHAVAPNSYEIYLDTNQDGTDDYLIINRDVSLNDVTDGRNLAWVVNLATEEADAFFFTDHEINSANTVLLVCAEQLGMTLANVGQPMNVAVFATDYFFGGDGDIAEGITLAPGGEQYLGVFAIGGPGFTELGKKQNDKLQIVDFGPGPNTTETGLLLLYRDGALEDQEAGVVLVEAEEDDD